MSAVLEKMLELPSPLLLVSAPENTAIDLAKKLFGSEHNHKIDSGNHPDLHLYHPDEKSGMHPMASIQQLISEMALPPYEAKQKIFIITDAEKMLPSGSNALLKTLEEPNPDSFIILLSNDPDKLLPTIRSRLHNVAYKQERKAFNTDLLEEINQIFALQQEGNWPSFFEKVTALEMQDPQELFQALLTWAKRDEKTFQTMSDAIERAQMALQHNVKLRNVLTWLFFEIR